MIKKNTFWIWVQAEFNFNRSGSCRRHPERNDNAIIVVYFHYHNVIYTLCLFGILQFLFFPWTCRLFDKGARHWIFTWKPDIIYNILRRSLFVEGQKFITIKHQESLTTEINFMFSNFHSIVKRFDIAFWFLKRLINKFRKLKRHLYI